MSLRGVLVGGVALAAAIATAGCGAASPPTVEAGDAESPATGPAVRIVALGEPPTDAGAVGVAFDDRLVVAAGDATFRSWTVGRDGAVTEGPGPAGATEPVDGSSVWVTAAATDGSTVVVVGTRTGVGPFAWVSADGAAWEEVPLPGVDRDGQVHDVAATDDGFVAVGSAAWRSVDGRAWTVADGPTHAGVHDVEAVGDELVLVAEDAGGARQLAVWRSGDGGTTWPPEAEIVPGASAAWLARAATAGGDLHVLAASAPEPGAFPRTAMTVFTSTGPGSWAAADLTTALPPGDVSGRLAGGPGVVMAMLSSRLDPFVDPDACYADLDRCVGFTTPADVRIVIPTADGWRQVDPDAVPARSAPTAAGRFADGSTWVLAIGGTLEVWLVDGPPASLPTRPPVEAPSTEGLPPLAGDGATLAVGTTYRYPLHLHCGGDILGRFGGRWWWRTSSVWTPGEPVPDGWPLASGSLLGTLRPVAEDRIEYSVGDEVVATYEPRDQEPPVCA